MQGCVVEEGCQNRLQTAGVQEATRAEKGSCRGVHNVEQCWSCLRPVNCKPFDVGGSMSFVEPIAPDTPSEAWRRGGVDDAFDAVMMSTKCDQLAAMHRQDLGEERLRTGTQKNRHNDMCVALYGHCVNCRVSQRCS